MEQKIMDLKSLLSSLTRPCAFVAGIWISSVVFAQEPLESATLSPTMDKQPSPNQDGRSNVISIESKIIDVTLSQDIALVTRDADIPADANFAVYDFGTLPVNVILDTVHARTSDGVVLDSLMIPEKDKDLRKQQLESLQKELVQLEREQSDLVATATRLDRQSSLIERALDVNKVHGNSDSQRVVFDATPLKSLLEFGLDKQSTLSLERQKSTQQLIDIEHSIEEAKRRIAYLTNRSNHRFRVQGTLSNKTKGPGKLQLTYFVKHCSWEPAYELRYTSKNQSFRLLTAAKISQNSGEDWSNVQLRLAGTSSLLRNEMPVLVPLQVRSSRPTSLENRPTNGNKNASLPGDADEAELDNIRADWNDMSHGDTNSERNRRALLLQESELRNDAHRISLLAGDGNESLGDFSIELRRPVTLVSQSVEQSIEVSAFSLVGSIVHTATPLLSSYAYREVEFPNGVEQSLLGGTVRVYEDEQLVGQTSLRSTQSGQPFSVGMGPDAKVRARRELVSKSKDTQGGNVREEQSIKLVIANYHSNPIRVRLFDRIPLSTDQQTVAIEYSKTSPVLSKDQLYLRTLLPKNILRWDLEVPQSRFGANAFDHHYAYQIVHDKSSVLSIAFRQVSSDLEELDELLYDLEVLSSGGGMGGMGGMGGR
jgi:uncharacterized protein (TIGR02231 family)